MIDGAYIFRSSQEIPGFFDQLFGGLYLVKGLPLFTQLGILVMVPLATFCAVAESITGKKIFRTATQISSLAAFTLIAVNLLQPWDELFVNLRHSLHWAESNHFSFNRYQALEGTVDFLPYFLIGCLGKLGLPIVDLSFLLSFAGGLLCLWAGVALMKSWRTPGADTWGVLLFSLYAPLIFNSANGFTASLFSAATLGSIRLLFHEKRHPVAGLILLSLLPLIRVDGTFLIILLLCLLAYERRACRPRYRVRHALAAAAVFVPIAALTGYRWVHFDHFLPLPVLYKSAVGSLFYLLIGMRNLVADVVACYTLLGILAVVLGLVLLRHYKVSLTKSCPKIADTVTTIGPLLCLGVFSLPYYLSGGDWFPSYWGRYILPFSLYTILLAGCVVAVAFGALPQGSRHLLVIPLCVTFAIHTLWPISAYWKLWDQTFSRQRTLAKIHSTQVGRGHYRIHHLSQLGAHLARSTLPTDTIASSEVATIMFYARRETIDLLGIVNPEIIAQPLRQSPDLLRKFPASAELPYLIFKRINSDLVERYRPQIVYTFDFLLRDLLKELPLQDQPSSEVTDSDLFTALRRWYFSLKGLIDPLYKGTEELLRLGYRPVIVIYANRFTGMYFVSREAIEGHLGRLKRLGFSGGWRAAPAQPGR